MNKSFVDRYFKSIVIICVLITISAVGIIIYVKIPNPPPYSIAKTQDSSDLNVRKGILHIYTEATTEKHLFETAKSLSNTYNNYELLYIFFYRDGDPVDYGATVGATTVHNKKAIHININTQADEELMREFVKKEEQEVADIQDEQPQKQLKTKQIAQFMGSNNKQTKKITINTDEFTIKSRLSPDNEYALLIVYLYNSDGTLNKLVTSTTDNSPTESTIYGVGEYYLDIAIANGSYNIRVIEEY